MHKISHKISHEISEEEFLNEWTNYLNDFKVLKFNLPKHYWSELEERIKDMKELINLATIERRRIKQVLEVQELYTIYRKMDFLEEVSWIPLVKHANLEKVEKELRKLCKISGVFKVEKSQE